MTTEPTPQAATPHTVTSANVGTSIFTGAGTISAFTMNQPTSASTDDSTPLTLVDQFYTTVASAAMAASGASGVNGTGVYAVSGGTGASATLNCTWTAGVLTVNSVASPGNYTTLPTSPAALTYVSGTATGWTGATVTLTPAIPSGLLPPSRVLYSANLRALACEYEPRPGVGLTPGTTAPTWPKSLSSISIPITTGCFVQSCPANTTFTVSI